MSQRDGTFEQTMGGGGRGREDIPAYGIACVHGGANKTPARHLAARPPLQLRLMQTNA